MTQIQQICMSTCLLTIKNCKEKKKSKELAAYLWTVSLNFSSSRNWSMRNTSSLLSEDIIVYLHKHHRDPRPHRSIVGKRQSVSSHTKQTIIEVWVKIEQEIQNFSQNLKDKNCWKRNRMRSEGSFLYLYNIDRSENFGQSKYKGRSFQWFLSPVFSFFSFLFFSLS